MTNKEAEAGGFDLGQFRYDVAAMVKYMIRARATAEPSFAGSVKTCAAWGVDPNLQDQYPPEVLLGLARKKHEAVFEQLLSMGGSGGVPIDDPLGDFKLAAMSFVDDHAIDDAVARLRQHDDVDWSGIAQWESLPRMRSVLDSLPHPKGREEATTGPCPPDKFLYDGLEYRVPGNKPYKLIEFLWPRTNRTASVGDLAEPVWGDREKDISDAMLGSVRATANRFFKKHVIPFRISRKNDFASLSGPDVPSSDP